MSLIDWTKPVRRKGATEVLRVLTADALSDHGKPIAVVMDSTRIPHGYYLDGTPVFSASWLDQAPVENVPEDRIVYVHEYTLDNGARHYTVSRDPDDAEFTRDIRSNGSPFAMNHVAGKRVKSVMFRALTDESNP